MLRNRIIYIILVTCMDIFFVLLFLIIGLLFINMGLSEIFFIAFFILFIIGLLPILSFIHKIIGSYISPFRFEDRYVETVDSILNVEFFDEMLKTTFDQILELLSAKSGLLIFYNHKKSEFDIFFHKNKRRKIIRGANIEVNKLYYLFNGPDDVIVKNKLDPSVYFIREIRKDIEKLKGEILVPIYYQETFLGLVVICERHRLFPISRKTSMNLFRKFFLAPVIGLSEKDEVRLLKIFASRIAILSANSFYFHQILEKKELEKEYGLASKTLNKFLPKTDLRIGRVNIAVYNNSSSIMARGFYDLLVNDSYEDEIRISAYCIHSDMKGSSVLMPGVKSTIQTFARLGFSPFDVVSRLKNIIIKREMLDAELMIFHGLIRQNGDFIFHNSKYPMPLIFKKSLKLLYPLQERWVESVDRIILENGDIIIIICQDLYDNIRNNILEYSEVINRNSQAPLDEVRSAIVDILEDSEDIDMTDKDQLFILLRVEDVA
ncbi:MAG: hypothetical protein SVR08_07690 [Spirochaetota bacterium]|nr:hypothetical protein [Spirochaetota bacterium]